MRDLLMVSEQLQKTLIDNTSIGISYLDLDGRVTYANKTLLSWLGLEDIPPEGFPASSFVTGKGLELIEQAHLTRVEGQPNTHEIELVSKTGSSRSVILSRSPLTDEAGRIQGAIGSFIDVTDFKRSMHLLRMTLESIPIGVLVVQTKTDRVLIHNRNFQNLWNIPDSVLSTGLHQPLFDFAVQMMKDPMRFLDNHRTYTEQRAMVAPFKEIELRNGRYIDLNRSIETLPFLGEVKVICATDVTERKKFEDRLLHADRMSIVGILSAGIAHEINNPLTHLIFGLELVADRLSTPAPIDKPQMIEMRDRIESLSKSASRIAEIVKDLKTFSRTSDERVETIDIKENIESIFPMVNSELKQKAALVTEFKHMPLVQGNSGRLSQVFLNLVVNGLQAMSTENRSTNILKIRTGQDDRGWAKIEVSDNGVGISPENLRMIFEPFFTTKPVGTGTGLGLSICQNIIKGFGGIIEVESKLNEGSVFRVLLPPSQTTKSFAPREVNAMRPLQGKQILFIDDEHAICEMVKTALSPSHLVMTCDNGIEAIRILESRGEEIDLVICDLMMPHMNGMELYQQVQSRWPSLIEKFIFITGGAMNPNAKKFIESVPNQVLYKPFTLKSLRSLIESSPVTTHYA